MFSSRYSGSFFCGSLYPSPPASTVGELFLIITGPGNPNVYDYQTSIRLPVTRVPAIAPIQPYLEEDFIEIEEGFARRPRSQSGWLVDLSSMQGSGRLMDLEDFVKRLLGEMK